MANSRSASSTAVARRARGAVPAAPRVGWPVPLMVSEVGAVALTLAGRSFVREFVAL